MSAIASKKIEHKGDMFVFRSKDISYKLKLPPIPVRLDKLDLSCQRCSGSIKGL